MTSTPPNIERPRFNQAKLINLGAGAFFFLLVFGQVIKLIRVYEKHGEINPDVMAQGAATASTVLFLSLMGSLILFRRDAIDKAKGVWPRIAALAGTFGIATVVMFPKGEPTLTQSLIGLGFVCAGYALSAFVLSFLGRSFSLMAEARKLVTNGPYSLVRHPLYMAEEVAIIGVVIQFFSWPGLVVMIAHIAVQIQRMKNEEKVLRGSFPEYDDYMLKTPRIIPGIY